MTDTICTLEDFFTLGIEKSHEEVYKKELQRAPKGPVLKRKRNCNFIEEHVSIVVGSDDDYVKAHGNDSDSESKSPSYSPVLSRHSITDNDVDNDDHALVDEKVSIPCGFSSPEYSLFAWGDDNGEVTTSKEYTTVSLSSVGVGGGEGTENLKNSCSRTASKAIPESSRTSTEESKTTTTTTTHPDLTPELVKERVDNVRAYFSRSGTRKGKTRARAKKQQTKMESFVQKFAIPAPDAPYWVYLMSIAEQEHCTQKTLTHVGKARDPVAKVYMHNNRLLRSKSTRPASGLWNLELIIGPFEDKKTTEPICIFWKKKRRGPASRRELGIWLAATLGLECYDARYGEEDDYAEKWNESRKKRAKIRRHNQRPCKRKKNDHNDEQ
jgi:hypothetical protein